MLGKFFKQSTLFYIALFMGAIYVGCAAIAMETPEFWSPLGWFVSAAHALLFMVLSKHE